MMSLRAFARSAPRCLAHISPATTIRRSVAASAYQLRTPLVPSGRHMGAALSTSAFRRGPADNEVDEELLAKFDSEIQFETEVRENEPQPASVKDFLESGLFEIEDKPGQEEVTLRRTYGNENITVTFSIADIANYESEIYDEDPALAEDDATGGRIPASQDAMASADAIDDGEGLDSGEAADAAAPCRLSIVVEKAGQGALNIDATAQDGSILVENLHYYPDATLAHVPSAQVAHEADKIYAGPPFGNLDEDLQLLMERYLEERGITQALAVFIPDYVDMKEQREYVGWLKNVRTFLQ